MAASIDIALPKSGPDRVSVRRWALVAAGYLLALGLPTLMLLHRLDRPWSDLFVHPGQFTTASHQALKLLIFTLYLTLCCTFLPLPTGWIVAAVATREVAVAPNLWATVLLVGLTGAIGSTMANLNDFHLFTLLLRNRHIAAVRDGRWSRLAMAWFERAPFTLLLAFNVLPIPVDVVRMLAAAARYSRGKFALANLLGRFLRYGVLAAGAYALELSAGGAAGIMLGLAAAMLVGRAILGLRRHGRPDKTNIDPSKEVAPS